MAQVWGGTQEKRNYPLEGGALVVQASPLGECSRNPSVSVYQLALLCEAAFRFSEFFFLDSTRLPISWWVIYEHTWPHHPECSAVFDQKWHDPHAPLYLFIRSRPSDFLFLFCFVFLYEISPQRETFCQCIRGETKNGRSTSRHWN